jgi:hypothetical protein
MRCLILAPALLVLGSLVCAGCGGPVTYHVSGHVTYDGEPLPAGVIYFDPDVTKSNDGPQGYAIIKDGNYNTSAEGGKGVVGGAYVARIEGFDGRPGEELPLGMPLFTDFTQTLDLPEDDFQQDFSVSRER